MIFLEPELYCFDVRVPVIHHRSSATQDRPDPEGFVLWKFSYMLCSFVLRVYLAQVILAIEYLRSSRTCSSLTWVFKVGILRILENNLQIKRQRPSRRRWRGEATKRVLTVVLHEGVRKVIVVNRLEQIAETLVPFDSSIKTSYVKVCNACSYEVTQYHQRTEECSLKPDDISALCGQTYISESICVFL